MAGKEIMIKIPEFVSKLQPYKAGKPIEELAREKGLTKIIKLASNENPLGPSPKAVETILKFVWQLHRYTDPSLHRLTEKIASIYNKKQNQIVCGSGSDSLIQYIVNAFTVEGDECLSTEGTFIGWYVNVNKLGRKDVRVPLVNYAYDLDLILNAITDNTKIIYLANPNNPTSTMFSKTQFEEFLEKVPSNILIIYDEAYSVYAEDYPGYANGMIYDKENLIVLRTLSKAFGLAGLRIGFACGNENLIKELFKVKLPFEPNLLAIEAAISALDDFEFIKRTKELNQKSLTRLKEFFDSVNLSYPEPFANFLLLTFTNENIAIDFSNECLNKGLILRHVKSFGIPNGVRINSGTEEETEIAIDIMSEVYNILNKKFEQTKQQ